MTDRTITLTPADAVRFTALPASGSMWIVREGKPCSCCDEVPPPDEFVQACAPCDYCLGDRWVDCTPGAGQKHDDVMPCPDCRLELVGPCPNCPTVGKCAVCGSESIYTNGTVTLGYAYAVGQPSTIADGRLLMAPHWALELAVTQ